jgi:dynein heavy chain
MGRQNPPLRLQEPQYAGSALWAHSLASLIKESFECLTRIRHVLLPRDFEEAKDAFIGFSVVVKDFKLARYNMWIEHLTEQAKDGGLQLKIEKFIMRRVDSDAGGASTRNISEIMCNFDEDILSLFSEVSYWEKFHGEFSIPYIAHDLCNKRDVLRVMRELVMLVVRAYNDILRDIKHMCSK